jgi:hypothetical protein
MITGRCSSSYLGGGFSKRAAVAEGGTEVEVEVEASEVEAATSTGTSVAEGNLKELFFVFFF